MLNSIICSHMLLVKKAYRSAPVQHQMESKSLQKFALILTNSTAIQTQVHTLAILFFLYEAKFNRYKCFLLKFPFIFTFMDI